MCKIIIPHVYNCSSFSPLHANFRRGVAFPELGCERNVYHMTLQNLSLEPAHCDWLGFEICPLFPINSPLKTVLSRRVLT